MGGMIVLGIVHSETADLTVPIEPQRDTWGFFMPTQPYEGVGWALSG